MLVLQSAFGDTWVLYDAGLLVAMLVCLITYAVYVQTMADFQPQYSYEVYDSLGGAQARLLLPKKMDPSTWNSMSCGLIFLFICPCTHSLTHSHSLERQSSQTTPAGCCSSCVKSLLHSLQLCIQRQGRSACLTALVLDAAATPSNHLLADCSYGQ